MAQVSSSTRVQRRPRGRGRNESTLHHADRRAGRRNVALTIFCVLFAGRLVSDAAFIPAGAQSALNQLIIFAAIIAGVLSFALPPRREKISLLPALLFVFFAWFVLAAGEVGFTQPITSAILRFAALLAMAALVSRAVREAGSLPAARAIAWTSTPFILALVLGTVTHSPLLFSSGTGRAFGTFNHTNSAASFVAVYVPLLIFLLARERKARYVFMLIAAVIGVVGTLSLGGLSALIAGTLILLAISSVSVGTKLASFAGLVIAGAIVFASGALGGRLSQLETTVSFDDASSATSTNSLDWRFYNWRRFLDLWEQRPLLGWGLGRADYDLQPIGKQPHSDYVRSLVEMGILGTFLLCLLLIIVIVRLVRSKSTDGWGKALALSTLGAVLVNALASNTVSYAPTIMLAVATWAIGSRHGEREPQALVSVGKVARGKTVRKWQQ